MTSDTPPDTQSETAWLRLLLACAILVSLVIVYVVLQSGDLSDRIRYLGLDVLSGLATGLLVFLAIFGVLNRLRDQSDERLESVVRRAVGAEATPRVFPNDIGQAAPFISELVAARPTKSIVKIDILAYTGATFCTAVLRDLLLAQKARRLVVNMHLVDMDKMSTYYPPHWSGEITDTVKRICGLAYPNHTVAVSGYGFHPFLLGLCIDDLHLFLAFPSWDKLTGKIADQALTYRYYERSDATAHFFDLYWSWSQQPGQREIIASCPGNRGSSNGGTP